MAFQPLDGPGVYGALAVTTTAIEVKVGASTLEDREVVTVQPIDGDVYYGYDSSVSASTGTIIKKGQFFPFEAKDTLPIYLVAASGTIDVRITEVA